MVPGGGVHLLTEINSLVKSGTVKTAVFCAGLSHARPIQFCKWVGPHMFGLTAPLH